MAQNIDYLSINIDTSQPRAEYHYTERRAEILRAIKRKGHPAALNQASLAREYGVSEAQISKDMGVLREYIADNIDETRVDAITHQVYETSITELLEHGEYDKATRAVERWNNWLFSRGMVEKQPEKLEADVNQTTSHELGDAERELALDTIRQLQENDSTDSE